MISRSVLDVLARANATLVAPEPDVTGALAQLLSGATEALPADAAAVLVESHGSLELLAATSHRVADLEVYQSQVDEGPCLDAIRHGVEVRAAGADALSARWPVAGPAIVRSGYASVLATPLTWQGTVFGGLNVFRSGSTDLAALSAACRALADAATMIVVCPRLGVDDLQAGLRSALAERAVVEQAKGALAHVGALDLPSAFDALVRLADEEEVPLGVAARRVMERARSGTLGQPFTGS